MNIVVAIHAHSDLALAVVHLLLLSLAFPISYHAGITAMLAKRLMAAKFPLAIRVGGPIGIIITAFRTRAATVASGIAAASLTCIQLSAPLPLGVE